MPLLEYNSLKSAGSIGLVAFALVSCAGGSAQRRTRHPSPVTVAGWPSATHRPVARISPAQPVTMTQTPKGLLTFCRRNPLLRPICPRRLPAWGAAHSGTQGQGYTCMDKDGNQPVGGKALFTLFTSRRCVDADWSYENGKPLPLLTVGKGNVGRGVSAWDGTQWFVPAYAAMDPPPWHVHVEVGASVGSLPGAGGPPYAAEGAHRVTDALLDPNRRQTVSLGWVRWYGRYGQLVLTPTNVNGGEWGGHLIFYFTANAVGYAITLHAWASKERISGRGTNRVVTFDSGPALPHVIATLKAIVGSAIGAPVAGRPPHRAGTRQGRATRSRSSPGGRARGSLGPWSRASGRARSLWRR